MELLGGLSLDHPNIMDVLLSNSHRYINNGLMSKLSDQPLIAALAWDALINFAADPCFSRVLWDPANLDYIMSTVRSRQSIFTESATKLLSNMTKHAETCSVPVEELLSELHRLYLAGINHNPQCNYDFLACAMSDLTNLRAGRLFFVEELDRLNALLPDLHNGSVVRRGGTASIIKNCLFETDYHDAILAKELDENFIITALTGRLLDSRSVLSEQEHDALPVELQLLDRHEAESDIAVRSIIVEGLVILGSTRKGRDIIRAKEVYPIFREWHLLEPISAIKMLIERLVELLIRDEEPRDKA